MLVYEVEGGRGWPVTADVAVEEGAVGGVGGCSREGVAVAWERVEGGSVWLVETLGGECQLTKSSRRHLGKGGGVWRFRIVSRAG